tara:strand:- start:463 stop:723 length:261 start_codon:yes stop_codon:yes gene_type:complete
LRFIEGIKESYPEIYSSNGGTEKNSIGYFEKWGWYATLDMLADGDILKIDKVTEIGVMEFHTFLAHKLDKQKMEAILRKGSNTTQL